MEFADRFMLDYYHGKAAVGVFTFYASLANAVRTVIETGIVMIMFPGVIAAFQKGQFDTYRILIRKMGMYMLAAVGVMAILTSGGVFADLNA